VDLNVNGEESKKYTVNRIRWIDSINEIWKNVQEVETDWKNIERNGKTLDSLYGNSYFKYNKYHILR